MGIVLRAHAFGTLADDIARALLCLEEDLADVLPDDADVIWLGVLSVGAFGTVTALLLALAGLPEAEEKPKEEETL